MQAIEPQKTISRADHIPGPPQGSWTYEAYCSIPDDSRRYEIIEGVLYAAPSPGARHQRAAGPIYAMLRDHLRKEKLGEAMVAPIDVKLADGTVLEPDVFVVLAAHKDRITEPYVDGPPDLVVEVESKSTARYDASKKLQAYERAGVPEYWIVDPIKQSVELFVLEEGKYRSRGRFSGDERIPSTIVPTFQETVSSFFD